VKNYVKIPVKKIVEMGVKQDVKNRVGHGTPDST